MKWSVVAPLTAIAVCGFVTTGVAASNDTAAKPAAGMDRMQRWTEDHEALLSAKLAGLKAALKLTPDQEKLWAPFETSVRDAAEMRMKHMGEMMKAMMERRAKMGSGSGGMAAPDKEDITPVNPVDRLELDGRSSFAARSRDEEDRRSGQAPLRQFRR